MFYKMLLFIGIVLGVLGQLALKQSTQNGIRFRKGRIIRTLFRMYFNKFFIIGGVCYVFSMILFIVILSHLDLSLIYPIISINFVFVSIFSKLIFKEKISKKRWLSMLIISIGVIITTLS